MAKLKSDSTKDRASAGLEAFGKDPKKMKGPAAGSKAPPFGKKPVEPDADDKKKGNPFGKGQDKKKGKY